MLIDQGIDRPRVISPHDVWRSIAFMRVNTDGDIRMPPLARETIDQKGVALLSQWILSLPGRAVLDPPTLSRPGGTYNAPLAVALQDSEPGAAIHYTLDGSEPDASDPLYQAPIETHGHENCARQSVQGWLHAQHHRAGGLHRTYRALARPATASAGWAR